MTYPDNEVVTNTYKPQLLLNSVAGSNTYVTSTLYDPAGRMTARQLGNGLTQAYGYYPRTSQGGRLQAMSTGTLQSLAYQYDAIGNITQIQDAITNETQTFVYDALYRLTSATASNGLAPYSESYAYDPITGNLASKAGVSYTYGDPDHVHAVTSAGTNTYEYDDNGNQVTRNIGSDSFTLLYDAENRLVEVQKNGLTMATFAYDGDGKRVKSVIGGETILFVGGHYEVVNGSASKYYFAGAQRVAVRKNGALSYLIGDHLGSTSIATDGSGNKISELKYKAWGEVRYASGVWVTDYTYTGQYSNVDDFGLMFYGARWYDLTLSRWAQADPIVPLEIQGVQAWDRYAYVNNNPVTYTDPNGHCVWDLCVGETVSLVLLAAAATTAVVSVYYLAGGPEAVSDSFVNLGDMLSPSVDQTAEQLAKLDNDVREAYSELLTNMARGDGGAKSSAEHLTMLLGVSVAGFAPHSGKPDPEGRDRAKNARDLRNTLRSMQKNMKSGENFNQYLSRQGWSTDQIADYTQQLRNYLDNVLPYEKNFDTQLIEDLLQLGTDLGI